ncbi:hypothetical protein [Marinomonas sp.]|uniref:hypothetical protein n=1 Tax=Marinomonas sp. TaxID=1904862 RepID=UPI003BABC03F
MLDFYKSYKRSSLILGLLTGAYLGLITMLFKEKLLNIHNLDLGQIGSFLGRVFAPILFFFVIVQHFSQQNQILEAKAKEMKKEEEKNRLAQPFLKIQDFRYEYETGKNFNDVGEKSENSPCSNLSFLLKNLGTNTHSIKIVIDSLDFEKSLIEVLNYSDEKYFPNMEIPKINIETKNITIKLIYIDYYRVSALKSALLSFVLCRRK